MQMFASDQTAEEVKGNPEIKKEDIVKEGWLIYQQGTNMFSIILKQHETNDDYGKIQSSIMFNESTTVKNTEETAQIQLDSDGQSHLFQNPDKNAGAMHWWKEGILESITASLGSGSALSKLEHSLPFKDIQLEYMMTSLLNFKDDNGKLKEFIKISEFKSLFGDQKWSGHFVDSSDFSQYLNCLPDNKKEGSLLYLNLQSLIAMCVLHLEGDIAMKTELFLTLINPPGQANTDIAINDKELVPSYELLVRIALDTAIKFAKYKGLTHEFETNLNEENSQKAVKAMYLSDDDDKPGFVAEFYGCNSFYSKERFIEEMVGASNGQKYHWVYNPSEIRNKLDSFRDEKFLDDVEFIF